MIRWVAVASVLMSCQRAGTNAPRTTAPSEALDGRSTPAAPGEAPTGSPGGTPAAPAAATFVLEPEAACARFDALAGEGCDWTQRFPPQFRDASVCVTTLRTWFAPETPQHQSLQRLVGCWALDCDAAAACMVRLKSSEAAPPPRNCGEEGTAPILVDAATWAGRRGANARRFSDVTTTVEEPVEVCGVEGEVEWMTRVRCNDGSNPYGTQAVANESRDAWVARGGRCNSVLDRYSVRCPEATYQVYVDRYVCPRKP